MLLWRLIHSNRGEDDRERKGYLGYRGISPYSKDMAVSNQPLGNDLPALGFEGRQLGGGAIVGTTVLPTGAIIGIAVVGSAILFGLLTVTILYYLRSKYKLKNISRDLDLNDDNEEDILDALRYTHPSEHGLVTKLPHRPLKVGSESLPTEWTDIPLNGRPLDMSKLMPPAYAFEITGLRNSWPLVGWVESASTVPISANKHSVINSSSTGRRMSYSASPLSIDNEPAWPQLTPSRPSSYIRGVDGRRVQRSGHSARSSITSLKRLSSTRKSVSDNQLSSILRSTSQRLREQRRPLSRSLSVMSQVSGAPPTMQPPSPPGEQKGESLEALIDTDDRSLVDSVRSSVLNSVSQTPSPQKMALHATENIEGNEKRKFPTTSEKSEPGSLCPSKTHDLFIPATHNSPSKQGARASQRHAITISTGGHSNMVHQKQRHCLLTRNGTDIVYSNRSSNQLGSTSDPLVSADLTAGSASKSMAVKGPRPLIKRQVILEQNTSSEEYETITSPLGVISGNQKSPNKSAPAEIDLSAPTQENPFQWSPLCSPSLVFPSSQKPAGIKSKGHRRCRTVRLSHVARPASVAVLFEEPENEPTPNRVHELDRTETLQLLSPTKPENTSKDPNQSRISSSRPPSVPIFEPFLTARTDSKISSDGPYSATMSFYDSHSSGGAFPSDSILKPEPGHSPTPSTKKSRRRGCNFSIDVTRARDVALLEATTSGLQENIPVPPPKSAPAQFLNFEASKDANMPNFTSRLCAPTSPQHPIVSNSITSSVSLLRRMNSEVSAYSTGSLLSDHSNGSPTIPELRGGGLSPTKRGSEGTMNYLNIGVKTPSRTGRRERVRALANVSKSRDHHQSLILEDRAEQYDALGLVMPILENLPPKFPSLEPMMNVSNQGDWSPTPRDWPSNPPKWPSPPRRTNGPAARLRPMSTTPLSQENCQFCNKPLSPLRLNPRNGTLASRYHDHCFKCSTCNKLLETAFAVGKNPYCKQHYYEKAREICNVISSPSQGTEQDGADERWSEVMITPLKKNDRHKVQREMSSPHAGSPKSITKWRGSLGLYDEMGFLKTSPDRSPDSSSFGLGPADDLMMGT